MTAVTESPSSWDVRRMRAEMLSTLPALPRALCRQSGVNPDLWHPTRTNRKQEATAIKVCLMCPELLSCLSYAMRAHPISGVWGGTTEAQRRVIAVAISVRQSIVEHEQA